MLIPNQQYETLHLETQAVIRNLAGRNQQLEDDLLVSMDCERELKAHKAPPVEDADDDSSYISSVHPNPQPPPPLPPVVPVPAPQSPIAPLINPPPMTYHPPLLPPVIPPSPIPPPVQAPIQHPIRPPIDPNTTVILHQLIQAQQQSNIIQTQARTDDLRARIQMTPIKFPRLNCLSDETITVWYPRVIGLLMQPKYSSFYDPISSDLVPDGTFDPQLNTLLYSELITPFSHSIQEYIFAKHDLQNDDIGAVHDINTSFIQSWNQMQKDDHQKEWIGIRIKNNESFHDYFPRCLKLRNLSIAHGIACNESDLKDRFVMGLPAIFTPLQEKSHNLPDEWNVTSIHQLPALTEKFQTTKNSVRNLHRANQGDQRPNARPNNNTNNTNPTQTHNNNTPQQNNNTQQQNRDLRNSFRKSLVSLHKFLYSLSASTIFFGHLCIAVY